MYVKQNIIPSLYFKVLNNGSNLAALNIGFKFQQSVS